MKKKPLLFIKYRKRRLYFAPKCKNWTMMNWTRDIWSDKTKLNRIGSNGRMYTWKKTGKPLQNNTMRRNA